MSKSYNIKLVLRLGLLLLAIGLFAETFEFRHLSASAFGPATWPRIVLILLALSAAADFYFSIRYDNGDRNTDNGTIDARGICYLLVALAAYVGGMSFFGFPLATVLFCAAFLLLHELRDLKRLVLIAFTITAVMVVVFVKVLYLSLPRGMWYFYDLTNFILALIGR